MRRAEWSYETPAAGADAAGVEGYVVWTADGSEAGKVVTLLRHEGELWLAVDLGAPPLSHDRRAIPFAHVESIDHDALGVQLGPDAGDLADALRLPPELAVEERPADAERVSELPRELVPPPTPPGAAGPSDRRLAPAAIVLALLAAFSALAVISLIAQRHASHWRLGLIAIPVALFAAAIGAGWGAWVRPYRRPLRRRR